MNLLVCLSVCGLGCEFGVVIVVSFWVRLLGVCWCACQFLGEVVSLLV